MEYRMATDTDIEMLMRIRLETLRAVNGLSENHPFSDALIIHSRRYFLAGNTATALALDEGEAVACASLAYIEVMPTLSHPTGLRAHLMNVYTRPNYRRRGISRRLIQMLIEQARQKGVTEISLDTTDAGRPLYEALGFRASQECMTIHLNDRYFN